MTIQMRSRSLMISSCMTTRSPRTTLAWGPYLGSTSPISFFDSTDTRLFLSGLQFWNLGGIIDSGTGMLGAIGRPSWISQEVDVVAGQTTQVSLSQFEY